ncbi:MAG: hypothetical protein HKN24_06195 [Acidimicrobiales bacterium]|nr:hypothetical protein [Acidimicrobiales bacterium]
MGKRVLGLSIAVMLCAGACAEQEATAPTFQVTSPTLASTSTTQPDRLEYLGLPELSQAENDMCRFIVNVGQDLEASDGQSRRATAAMESAIESPTLSEPLRVRLIRDTEIANAQRFANVLSRFADAIALIDAIEPGPLSDEETLANDAQDAALITEIGADIQETIDSSRPLSAAEQAAYLARTGTEWIDLFTERELENVLRTLHNETTGMGREAQARDAMERLDDWSWRHCAAGLTN